jgi:hypothetical protein
MRSYLGKSFTKIGLVEWLQVKAPSSNPSTEKKKKKKRKRKEKGASPKNRSSKYMKKK